MNSMTLSLVNFNFQDYPTKALSQIVVLHLLLETKDVQRNLLDTTQNTMIIAK